MSCDDEAKVAGTIAVLAGKVPHRGFKDAIDDVKKMGRPLTLDISEGAMDLLGGAAELGKRMAMDLKRLRGEDLDPEALMFHDPDFKTIKGLYEALIRLSVARDKMIGDQGDPLDGVSEEDLMVIASQAAMLRIESDGDFRRQLIAEIVKLDPQAILDVSLEALDLVEAGPRVDLIIDGEVQ